MLERLSSEEVTEVIIIVLLAYHMRETDRLEAIIKECGTKNRLHEFWPEFQAKAEKMKLRSTISRNSLWE